MLHEGNPDRVVILHDVKIAAIGLDQLSVKSSLTMFSQGDLLETWPLHLSF